MARPQPQIRAAQACDHDEVLAPVWVAVAGADIIGFVTAGTRKH